MEAMILSFNAIFPLLAFMMLGYFLGRVKLIDQNAAAGINKLVFNVLLPANIINSIYKANLQDDFDIKIALFAAFICLSSFLIISFVVNKKEPDKTIAPVMAQGMFKSNYNLLIIPIAGSFCGTALGMAAILVMVTTPILNTCSTIAFETARGKGVSVPHILKKVILNPLVLSSIIAVLINLSGIKIPAVISSGVIEKLSSMATPAAMIALGMGFDFESMKKWKTRLSIICFVKLIIMPIVYVSIALLCGIRGANLIAMLILSGGPTAVNSYSTAVALGGNGELAGEIVALTSLLSVLSLFVFLTAIAGWVI